MRTFYIINPRAGAWRIRRLFPAGSAWALTDGPRHAVELTRNAAYAGYEAVAACGGDGTVNEVLNGLMEVGEGHRPALGIVPMGTANDLARSLGLPLRADAALRLLGGGILCPMDVGTAAGAWGERYFGVSAFAGAAAEMAARANRRRKWLPGLAGYLPWLPRFLPYSALLAVRADGEEWSGHALSVQAANGATGGGGLQVHPGARLDDGLLDVMIIRAASLTRTLGLLANLPSGRHTRLPQVIRRSARRVEISGDSVSLALDGEIVGTLPARIGIRPRAVRVIGGPAGGG